MGSVSRNGEIVGRVLFVLSDARIADEINQCRGKCVGKLGRIKGVKLQTCRSVRQGHDTTEQRHGRRQWQ